MRRSEVIARLKQAEPAIRARVRGALPVRSGGQSFAQVRADACRVFERSPMQILRATTSFTELQYLISDKSSAARIILRVSTYASSPSSRIRVSACLSTHTSRSPRYRMGVLPVSIPSAPSAFAPFEAIEIQLRRGSLIRTKTQVDNCIRENAESRAILGSASATNRRSAGKTPIGHGPGVAGNRADDGALMPVLAQSQAKQKLARHNAAETKIAGDAEVTVCRSFACSAGRVNFLRPPFSRRFDKLSVKKGTPALRLRP